MAVIHLTKENFEDEVLSSEKPVLIDFFATWCGPCKMVSPIIDEIADENKQYKICKINVDEEPELSQAFNIASIPTIAVVKSGKVIATSVGARGKKDILAMLDD